jgi:hypothetical protein
VVEEVETDKTSECKNVFRKHKTKMVTTLSEGDSKCSNQSAQRETCCTWGSLDRLLVDDSKRGKYYSEGLNIIDRRISKV